MTGSTSSGKHVESSGSSGGSGSESLGALNTGEGYFQCLISNLGQWFSWVCVSVLFLFGSTTGLDSQETSNAVEWEQPRSETSSRRGMHDYTRLPWKVRMDSLPGVRKRATAGATREKKTGLCLKCQHALLLYSHNKQ